MDYTDPLGILSHYHEEILRHCDMLEECAAWVRDEHDPAQITQRSEQLRRFFSVADRLHHQDEELDLFPRLHRVSLKLADMIQDLRGDHKQSEAIWSKLDAIFAKPADISSHEAFQTLVADYLLIQRRHVEKENGQLLEMAAHLISQSELKKIGASFAKRRGQPG